MRVLGIDLGERRIGLAVSDEEGRIAFPAGSLVRKGRKADFAALCALNSAFVNERDLGAFCRRGWRLFRFNLSCCRFGGLRELGCLRRRLADLDPIHACTRRPLSQPLAQAFLRRATRRRGRHS